MNILIRVEIENLGRKAKVSCCYLGLGVTQVALGSFPGSIWDDSKGWEKAYHILSCVTFVTEEHLMFVKRTLTYLAMDIVRWGGK